MPRAVYYIYTILYIERYGYLLPWVPARATSISTVTIHLFKYVGTVVGACVRRFCTRVALFFCLFCRQETIGKSLIFP